MPEGHTLHRLATSLQRAFGGEVVAASSPQGRFDSGARLLDGTTLESAEAWGKHLFVDLDDHVLHVHLGLYGTWPVEKAPAPAPQGAVRLRLESSRSYADLRGPTACDLVGHAGRDLIVARLGPDPLRADSDPERFVARVRSSRALVGGMLMDQSVIAGVGNIYRAEVLFRHRISPYAEGRQVSVAKLRAVWEDLVVLMHDGVRRGRIVTVAPDDVEPLAALDVDRPASDDPELDGDDDSLAMRRRRRSTGAYVYGRAGRPCLRCGRSVRVAELQGRRLFWCGYCQRTPRSR
ncbi:MAG TPA: DNA-formamidopyrimidine glycosylase family protein [Candidatus Nanopelagicales bacterium]|nr:DNA-formamidopyrimidine glycosylase family protein [Candidatus Nanopelagicales bacterium]